MTMTTDPYYVAELRVQFALELLQSGDAIEALLETEELLDDMVGHPEALFLAGQSQLLMGNIVGALLTLQQAALQSPNESEIHVGIAAAAFDAGEYQLGLSAAKFAIKLGTKSSIAWRYKGLCLERLGKPNTAHSSLLRAFELDAKNNPLPDDVNDVEWVNTLNEAMSQLAPHLQDLYDNLPVVWLDFPDVDTIKDSLYKYTATVPLIIKQFEDTHQLCLYRSNLKVNYPPSQSLKDRIMDALIDEGESHLMANETVD